MNVHMSRSRRLLVGIATTFAIAVSAAVASPAQAATEDQLDPETTDALQTGITPGSRTFDGAIARAAGASPENIEAFATGWVIAGGTAQHAPVDREMLQAVAAQSAVIRACAGKNRWDYTGLQLNVYLNSCNTTRLLGAIASGAGAATVVGIITAATGIGGAAAGVIAGGLAIAGGILTSCAAKGRGVAIHNIAPGPVVWCNGQ